MTQTEFETLVHNLTISEHDACLILAAAEERYSASNGANPIVSGSLPPDSEVEKWFAGEKVDDAKFWSDAPFRENGDVVGIVIDALKYFMSGNDR